ncbi:variable large family protein (plasmid) [Borrelia venezuelensis]|nr:variable large family protein [Borrelia venezuelensis]UPA12794.1 variable large family protein [Borrelia venezuelensis]UPA12886.1 variable large family protein [Borrelia venezuelensis]
MKLIEDAIKGANDIFEQLISALTTLAGATRDTIIVNGIHAAASASIGAITGADILQSIASSKENPTADSTDGIEKATDAAEIAIAPVVANKKEIKEEGAKKDAVIAAGIALRAMAKDGKFAAKQNEDKFAHAVNGVAASAVGKTLSTLIIAIKNTVDSGLKSIS